MQDAAQALSAVENALRLAIASRMGTAWTQALSPDKLERIRERQSVETNRREGVITLPDLVEYTDFTDLSSLILKRWEAFKVVFDDKKRTEVYFGFLEDVRNTIAHSRPRAQLEIELLSGISTHLRNQVAMSRMSAHPASEDYPLIESVLDSFGSNGRPNIFSKSSWPALARVAVGEQIEFICEASDPRGRNLEWFSVKHQEGGKGGPVVQTAMTVGNRVSLTIAVEESDVGEELFITVYLRHQGEFHLNPERFGSNTLPDYDDVRHFKYAVRPPLAN